MSTPDMKLWMERIPGGGHWSGIVRRGTTLRLVDLQGGANVATLFYNMEEKLERYNMADTLKSQHTFRLTKGHACHSDMGRIFCCIAEDTVGWHDTVCGVSDAAMLKHKYGEARFQEQRNEMYRSGLDGLLIELGKWGLGRRDVVSNINFFSKVTANKHGEMKFHSGNSKAAGYVALRFEMDTLVVLSTAPHPLDPAPTYQPAAVELVAFATPESRQATCGDIAENTRGIENTRRFYMGCGGAA